MMTNELTLSLMAILVLSPTIVIVHKVGRYPLPFSRSKHPTSMVADALLVWAIDMAAILMFFTIFPAVTWLVQDIVFVPALLAPILYVRRKDKWDANDFGLAKNVIGRQTWVLGIAFSVFWSVLAGPFDSPLPLNPNNVAYVILKLYSPAFFEEVLARGIIQGKMERCFSGALAPILLTGILFTLWHVPKFFFSDTGIDFPMMLLDLVGVYLGGGILLGILYRKTRSLLPGIIVHYLYDFGPQILSWLIW